MFYDTCCSIWFSNIIDEPRHTKKDPLDIFIKIFIFLILNVHYVKINLWKFDVNSFFFKFASYGGR